MVCVINEWSQFKGEFQGCEKDLWRVKRLTEGRKDRSKWWKEETRELFLKKLLGISLTQ